MIDGRLRALIGFAVWLVVAIWLQPNPFAVEWAHALLALAPLVVVPLGLHVAADVGGVRIGRAVHVLQLPTAILFAMAYSGPSSLLAVFAVPWLVTTGLIALDGIRHLAIRRSLADICLAIGMIQIPIGATWAVADRLGHRPLTFEPVIVLLTTIHFHYAGFALPLLTGLALKRISGVTATMTAGAVIAGVPLVAVGITATQLGVHPLIEGFAASILALAGIGASILYLRLGVRALPSSAGVLWLIAAASLAASMILAAMYGIRFLAPMTWLDIPLMRALHGSANALGFTIPALAGWLIFKR